MNTTYSVIISPTAIELGNLNKLKRELESPRTRDARTRDKLPYPSSGDKERTNWRYSFCDSILLSEEKNVELTEGLRGKGLDGMRDDLIPCPGKVHIQGATHDIAELCQAVS